jgi:hypothetical protein
MLVEERHHWAVRHERRDAVGLVGSELKRADPEKDDRDGDAHRGDPDAIGMRDPS